MQENDNVEQQELNETANNVNNYQEAIARFIATKTLLKHKIKKTIGYIGKQGEKFKDTENLFDSISQNRSAIYFKISLYKFLKKYPLLERSTMRSSFFKNTFKAIKVVCKENPNSFA